jgi:DNA-binding NarL/FixJ family response regulator
LLVLSPDLALVHCTREGWDIVRQLREDSDHMLLPSVIVQMAEEIQKRIRASQTTGDWEQCVVRKSVGGETESLTLCGFTIRDKATSVPSHIVILADRGGARDAVFAERKELYQLSNRETRIVQYIAKGLTNKEIGEECGITEPTVKAHVKRIMEKTGATTRTAVLARLYAL